MKTDTPANVNKMAVKPMLPLIISMALPPLCSMFMQYSYNFVDCIYVSWISEKALTAVSLSFPITTLMLAMSIGVGVGINVLIARSLGEKNQDLADTVVSHGLLLSGFLGTILIFLLMLLIRPYFSLFIDDPEIYDLCIQYMSICVLFQLPNMVHIAIQKIIQGTGNMLAPMGFQMAGVLVNFILDPVLIFGPGPFPALGIRGAAVSSLLGYTVSTILAFWVLIFTKQKVRIKTAGLVIDFSIFRQILTLGVPSFIMNALGAVMVGFTNTFLIGFSTTAVAFFGAYFKAQQMIVMTVNGLIQGCIPVMSFNYGARDRERLQSAFRCGTWIAVVLMGVGALFLSLFPAQILRIFHASEEMLSFGIPALRIMASSYVFNGIATMVASYMQSCGRVRQSVTINLMRQLLFLLPAMFLLSRPALLGMDGVWWSFLTAELLTCAYCLYVYRSQKVSFD